MSSQRFSAMVVKSNGENSSFHIFGPICRPNQYCIAISKSRQNDIKMRHDSTPFHILDFRTTSRTQDIGHKTQTTGHMTHDT